jgi:hypothetical protein
MQLKVKILCIFKDFSYLMLVMQCIGRAVGWWGGGVVGW